MASWGTDNQARRRTARHDQPLPDPAGTSIASRTLKFTMLSGKLLEGVQGSVKVSVGLWHPGKKDYLEPPQQSKLMVDGCDFFMDGELRFTVVKAPDLGDCLLMIELSDKRLLRKHEVGEGSVPMRHLLDFFDQDQDVMSERSKVLGVKTDTMPITGTLVKPDGHKNATNRGSWEAKVVLEPLTYEIDPAVFFKHLPHTIKFWVVLLKTDMDYNPLPQAGMTVKGGKKDEVPKISNVDRFRTIAAELKKQGRFNFAEGLMSEMEAVRKGTRVALSIQTTSNSQVVFGQIVAMHGNQHLTFGATEMYDHRLRIFLNQFSLSSGLWAGAGDVLKMLSPSAMADPDWDGDDDTVDFASLASLGTLFRKVGDALGSQSREQRVEALRELATRAPQALCSLALHVPFDTMVRELEEVIYMVDSGGGAHSIRRGASEFDLESMSKAKSKGSLLSSPSAHGASYAFGMNEIDCTSPSSTSNFGRGVLSTLTRAGQFLRSSARVKRSNSGMKASGSSAALDESAHDQPVRDDRTWHGTHVTPEQMASGQYEFSDVPRHGTLRRQNTIAPTKLWLLPGRLSVLQKLAAVLGREFIEKYVMPCLRHSDTDPEEMALHVGQLYYAASLAGSGAAEELMEIHGRLLHMGSMQQRLNAVHSIEEIARYDDEETAVYVQECILELRPLLVAEDPAAISSIRPPEDAKACIERVRDELVLITPQLFRCPEAGSSPSPVASTQASVSAATRAARTIQGMRVEHVREVTLATMAEILGAAVRREVQPAPPPSPEGAGPSAGARDSAAPPHTPTTPGGKRSREERFVEAALALMRVAGPESWSLIAPAWTPMLEQPAFHPALAAGLPPLCKLLTEDRAEPAPPDTQEFLRTCLATCVQLSDNLARDGDNDDDEESAAVVLWLMRAQAQKPLLAKLLGQLPIVLTAIDDTWPERRRWVRAMAAVYTAYLAEQRLKLPGAVWTVGQDGSVVVDGHIFQDHDFPITDSMALAYQLPAAVRICRQERFIWSKALVVHRSMGADTSMDVRWMISHSIHLFPALFEPDCVPVLCSTFESLLRDLDLDVAEGAHKNYLAFVIAVAATNPTRASQLARSFLDAGLWDRRLHFASLQAEQLPAYVQSGLVESADEEAEAALLRLLRHPCTTVRRSAAESAAHLIAWSSDPNAGGGISAISFLQSLIALSDGTARERQTLVWACTGLAQHDRAFVQNVMRPALEKIAKADEGVSSERSLVWNDVSALLQVLSGGGEALGDTSATLEELAVPLSAMLRGGNGSPTRRLSVSPTRRLSVSSPCSARRSQSGEVSLLEDISPGSGEVGPDTVPSRTSRFLADEPVE